MRNNEVSKFNKGGCNKKSIKNKFWENKTSLKKLVKEKYQKQKQLTIISSKVSLVFAIL